MTEARKRGFVRALALIVLLGAILPNITFLGHWSIRGLESVTPHSHSGDHAMHCHGSSSCANQAAYGFEWLARSLDSIVLNDAPERAHTPDVEPSPQDAFATPIDPPPQYA